MHSQVSFYKTQNESSKVAIKIRNINLWSQSSGFQLNKIKLTDIYDIVSDIIVRIFIFFCMNELFCLKTEQENFLIHF